MTCDAIGNPKPTWTWYRANKEVIEGETTNTLILDTSDTSVAGDYFCAATNSRGVDSMELPAKVIVGNKYFN